MIPPYKSQELLTLMDKSNVILENSIRRLVVFLVVWHSKYNVWYFEIDSCESKNMNNKKFYALKTIHNYWIYLCLQYDDYGVKFSRKYYVKFFFLIYN